YYRWERFAAPRRIEYPADAHGKENGRASPPERTAFSRGFFRHAAWPSRSASSRDGPRSLSPEIRPAALVEGEHTLAPVFGRHQAVIGLDLEGEPVGERHLQAAVDRLLGLPHRDRSVARNPAGDRECRLQ